MQQIVLQPLWHHEQMIIGIFFAKNTQLNSIIKLLPNAKWTKTHKCWYLPSTNEAYHALQLAVKNIAIIDNSLLKTPTTVAPNTPQVAIQKQAPMPTSTALVKIHTKNAHVLPNMQQHLQLKAYSTSTIKTYTNEMAQLLYTLKSTPADTLSIQRLKDYLQYCYTTLQLSENTLHSRMNALKFYYEQVLNKERFFWEVPRPKKPYQLPNFFNQDEIVAILKGTVNIKHKAMLMLAYSSGLRVSEVVAIKTYNIDSKRMCIKIEQAKGKKDRMVALSPVLLVMLREYCKVYKPKKEGYLFEGQNEGLPYGTRSLQEVLTAAKQRAGILKPGSIHALRHSFATHLVDRGTDVTIIQKIMGHNDLKTTMRYLHTSNKDLLKIISPLDGLVFE